MPDQVLPADPQPGTAPKHVSPEPGVQSLGELQGVHFPEGGLFPVPIPQNPISVGVGDGVGVCDGVGVG